MHALVLLGAVLAACVQSGEVWVRFTRGRCRYDVDVMANFGVFKGTIKNMSGDGVANEKITLHVLTEKATFDTILSLCRVTPAGVPDLTRENLFDVLKAEEYLEISNVYTRGLFLKNLARRSLLGVHVDSILFPDSRRPWDMPKSQTLRRCLSLKSIRCLFEPRPGQVLGETSDSSPLPSQGIFGQKMLLNVLNGLASVFGLEARVIGEKITICSCANFYSQYGSVENILLARSVSGMQILPSGANMLAQRSMWRILAWLATGLKISVLNVSDCKLSREDVREISFLDLTELNVSNCGLDGDCVSVLGDMQSAIKHTLHRLDVSWNRLKKKDLAAIATMGVQTLNMSACGMHRGDMCVFRNNCALRRKLKKLVISHNKLCAKDVEALESMALDELDMSNCRLSAGSLRPLAKKTLILVQSLRRLDISCNDMDAEDMEVAAGIGLNVLNICYCNLPKRSLAVFGLNTSVVKYTLERLDVTGNLRLGPEDYQSFSKIRHLELKS